MIFLPIHNELRFRLCVREKMIRCICTGRDRVYTEKNSMAS